jgi:hypothetical protein
MLKQECTRLKPEAAGNFDSSSKRPIIGLSSGGTIDPNQYSKIWNYDWSSYIRLKNASSIKYPYELDCPNKFWLGKYHFTLSLLLSSQKVYYHDTMAYPHLLVGLPFLMKKKYTCLTVAIANNVTHRNIRGRYEGLCPQTSYGVLNHGILCLNETNSFDRGKWTDHKDLCKEYPLSDLRHADMIIDEGLDSEFEVDSEDQE